MKGRTDGRTVDDVMVKKPNFLASMGYQYFLSYDAARAELRYKLYFKFLLLRAATRLCRDTEGIINTLK